LINAIRVMAGLVPAIHAVTWLVRFRTPTISSAAVCVISLNRAAPLGVDGRDKPGHDGAGAFSRPNLPSWAYPRGYGSATAATGRPQICCGHAQTLAQRRPSAISRPLASQSAANAAIRQEVRINQVKCSNPTKLFVFWDSSTSNLLSLRYPCRG
jgi:hypothetical protein